MGAVITHGRRPVGSRAVDVYVPEPEPVQGARLPFHLVADVGRGLVDAEVDAVFQGVLDVDILEGEIAQVPAGTVLDGDPGPAHLRGHVAPRTYAPDILEMYVGAVLVGLPADLDAGTIVVVPDRAVFADDIPDRSRVVPLLALDAQRIIVTVKEDKGKTEMERRDEPLRGPFGL